MTIKSIVSERRKRLLDTYRSYLRCLDNHNDLVEFHQQRIRFIEDKIEGLKKLIDHIQLSPDETQELRL